MKDADTVKLLEQALVDALLARDFDAVESMVATEFCSVGIRAFSSADLDRSAWFETYRRMELNEVSIFDNRVEVYGDTAISLVEGHWRGRLADVAIDEDIVITGVWLKRDGDWKLVRRHSNPLPPP
ncbi:MAG: nuclear transport factor 2 family protein [Phenylobacterium sp.]